MLTDAGISEYFSIICGWDGTDQCTKAFIINKILHSLNTVKSDTVLVGDSIYDSEGAKTAGVDFLGVSYGFGIKMRRDAVYNYPIAGSPEKISKFIIKDL